MIERRLLTPDDAAQYLGLRSRWAIYRLIAKGELPSLRVARKLRVDRSDLDGFIERQKCRGPGPDDRRVAAPKVLAMVPMALAPLSRRRGEDAVQ